MTVLLVWSGATPLRAQSNAGGPTARQVALADSIARFSERETGGVHQAMMAALGAAGEGEAGARIATITRKFFEKYLPADTLRAIVVDDMVATYTEGELAQLLQFYRSDVGRKLLKQSPATMARMQQRVSRLMTEHRDELMKLMMEGMPQP